MHDNCQVRPYPDSPPLDPVPPEDYDAAREALGEMNGVTTEACLYAAERGEKEPFRIDNDSKADWALRKIAEARQEHARITVLINEQHAELYGAQAAEDDRLESNTAWLAQQLEAYQRTVKGKVTKTTEKYRLLSGTLVRKKGGLDIKRDQDILTAWLKENCPEYVKTEDSPLWGEFKKILSFTDGQAVAPSGEIVPGVTVEQKQDTFTIETEG